MKTIILSADSTLDMPADMIRELDLRIIPSYVTLGDETLPDWPDVTQEDLLGFVKRTGKLAQTSAANPDDYEKWFRSLASEGLPIVHFAKSSGISSCYQNACVAAQAVGNVWVLDTKNLAGGSSMIILEAIRCGIEDPAALTAHLEAYRERIEGSFIIETLEFLHKGGRCSGVAMLGANLMNFKPCIVVKDGKMSVGKKYRGKFDQVLLKYLADRVGDASDIVPDHVFITHAGCDDAVVDACLAKLKTLGDFKEIHVTRAGCTVSSHCGRNTLGVLFIRTHPIN